MLFKGPLDSAVDEAINLRLKLEDLPTNTVEDVERQEKLLKEADEKIARLRCAADLLVAAEFWGENAKDKLERVRHAAVRSGHYVEKGPTDEFEQVAAKERRGKPMFHWPLEFPEVIVKRSGFDAFVGNPPFLGGKRISTEHGDEYEKCLKVLFDRSKGAADLCCYFFRRAFILFNRSNAYFGLLATNSIVEGDSRAVSLVQSSKTGEPFTMREGSLSGRERQASQHPKFMSPKHSTSWNRFSTTRSLMELQATSTRQITLTLGRSSRH